MDNVVKIGSCEKIKECIESELSISPTDAERVFCYLETVYQENSKEFGCINRRTASDQELVFGGGQYYINLPKSILMVIALLLDITLTKGVVSGLCNMLGIQTQSFYHLNQHKGEACLLRECLRRHNTLDPEGYYGLIGNECINNDLACRYRKDEGRCCIQKADIEEILTHFRETQIITR